MRCAVRDLTLFRLGLFGGEGARGSRRGGVGEYGTNSLVRNKMKSLKWWRVGSISAALSSPLRSLRDKRGLSSRTAAGNRA